MKRIFSAVVALGAAFSFPSVQAQEQPAAGAESKPAASQAPAAQAPSAASAGAASDLGGAAADTGWGSGCFIARAIITMRPSAGAPRLQNIPV